jgi:hypothetical protein
MQKKERKSYSRSKKFDEIQQDRKAKLRERSVQKKTGYERDIRTLSKRILASVHGAVEGECEVTIDDLRLAKLQLDKLITKTRVLSNNKNVDLTKARSILENEKHLIIDYIQGKRECQGLVNKKGQVASTNHSSAATNNSTERGDKIFQAASESFDTMYAELGFDDDEEESEENSQEEYFRSLGFGSNDEEEEFVVPVSKPVPVERTQPTGSSPAVDARTTSFRRMAIVLIDERISTVINTGIEHLMHYRRRRTKDDLSFREETMRYIEDEISFEKNKAATELKKKGYGDGDVREFIRLFNEEYVTNKNWMIRKCLHMSRVLEYRKGSTASG